jgi:hypothetical protein
MAKKIQPDMEVTATKHVDHSGPSKSRESAYHFGQPRINSKLVRNNWQYFGFICATAIKMWLGKDKLPLRIRFKVYKTEQPDTQKIIFTYDAGWRHIGWRHNWRKDDWKHDNSTGFATLLDLVSGGKKKLILWVNITPAK